MLNWILLAIIGVLQALDVATTYRGKGLPGFRELNPLTAWLIERLGVRRAMLLSEALLSAVLTITVVRFPGWATTAGLAVVLAAHVYVVAHNYRVLRRGEQNVQRSTFKVEH